MSKRLMCPGIFVSTPDLRQSLMSVLEGLTQASLLKGVITMTAFDITKRMPAFLWSIRKSLPMSLRKGIERRRVPEFLVGKVRLFCWYDLPRLLIERIAGPVIAQKIWLQGEYAFDRYVARHISGRYFCLYGVEHSSLESFMRQKAAGGLCLLRQVSSHGRSVAEIQRRVFAQFPEYLNSYGRLILKDSQRSVARKEQEYALADLIVANSPYVRDTFLEHGFNEKNVISIPTGFPAVGVGRAQAGSGDKPLRFIFAGNLSVRKGIPYLIQAWNAMAAGNRAELILAGHMEFSPGILRALHGNWRYVGALSQEALYSMYGTADVFILPTLFEGRSHGVLEAMSFGLPVITTVQSGCADCITSGIHGILVKAADVDSLYQAMRWCLENRSKLLSMGESCRNQAARWTMHDSNKQHLDALVSFLQERVHVRERA